jgi:hypothetical protein
MMLSDRSSSHSSRAGSSVGGLGQADAYPFVLSPPVIDKLHFVHDVVAAVHRSPPFLHPPFTIRDSRLP